MDKDKLLNIAQTQRRFFYGGVTKTLDFRIKQLKILKAAVEKNETELLAALKADLGKPAAEAYVSEIVDTISDINYALKNIRRWTKPQKVRTPFMLFPAASYIYPEPYGTVLIISPWNYPFKLAVSPLIGAIAAGNCAVIKPSELSEKTSRLMAKIIRENFDQEYISVVEGGREETQQLLAQKFDYIFFTGGAAVGKIIAVAAARNLTPLTLELGGKSPCIVDENVDIEKTAHRIVWGKFFNVGQSCIAPDYLLAHKKIKAKLLEKIKAVVREFYGENPLQSSDYGRIINEKHFLRISELLKEGNVVSGGETCAEKLYISPTVIDNIRWDSKIMQAEIFGPVLPVIEYENLDEIIPILNEKPKPLALYFFSSDKDKQEKIVRETSSGGVNINDTMAHIQNKNLPFGGVGESGMGAYQGRLTFDTFSHRKAVVKRSFSVDPKMKYPPYKIPLALIKKLMKFMG